MVPLVPPSSQGSPPRQPWSGQPAPRCTAAAAWGFQAEAKPTSLAIAQKENQLAEFPPKTQKQLAQACASAGAGAVEADPLGRAHPGEPVGRLREQSNSFGQQMYGVSAKKGRETLCQHHLV